jgi:uncharacterized membrane protein HdeD (DUF308 family)
VTTADPQPGTLRSGLESPPVPTRLLDVLPTWAIVGYGVVTALLGVAILAWPGATLVVAVALLAAQLIIAGCVQVYRAFGPEADGAGDRTLLALAGALSLLVALLVLRRPLQTLVIITLLVGAWWIIRGVLDLVSAIPGGAPNRGWSLLLGAVSLVAGVYVLLNPGISLATFVLVIGAWMVVQGVIIAAAPLMLRRAT